MWVDLLGSQIHYCGREFRTRVIEAGEGTPLILIHGLGGHAEAYSRTIVRWQLILYGMVSLRSPLSMETPYLPMHDRSLICWTPWILNPLTLRERHWVGRLESGLRFTIQHD